MNIDEHLNNLKDEYEKTDATWHLRSSGWEELRKRMDLLEPMQKPVWWKRYALAFAVITLFIGSLFGTYKISLASVPGDALYPVKILSERIIQNTTGNNQIAVDHRADEIIVLSERQDINREALMKVVIEYKESVEEVKQEIQDSGEEERSEEFQKKLENHHQRFDQVEQNNPGVRDEIKDAQEASDRERDEEEKD